jgi:SAM-dependent methyltransferase
LRPSESEYWDHVATEVKGKGVGDLNDNVWKRCAIVSRILAHRPIHARILEIGVGQGLGAAVVNLVTLGNISYVGTDVSVEFCKFVQRRWKLDVANTDILSLPDGPFDMIWAFDTLEHVRPEDRPDGYKEMGRVLAEHGVILINAPLDESKHESEFDWGMEDREVFDLADAVGGRISKWERYRVPEVKRDYLWAEITR